MRSRCSRSCWRPAASPRRAAPLDWHRFGPEIATAMLRMRRKAARRRRPVRAGGGRRRAAALTGAHRGAHPPPRPAGVPGSRLRGARRWLTGERTAARRISRRLVAQRSRASGRRSEGGVGPGGGPARRAPAEHQRRARPRAGDDVRDSGERHRRPRRVQAGAGIFLGQAERTPRKVDRDPGTPLDGNDVFALEAVIRTDGTRPSLLVRDDQVNQGHPLARDWADTLVATRGAVRACARAVGRIEPPNPSARNFFGTGWLVERTDATTGLVLTNLHVVEAMWRRLPDAMLPSASGYTILDGAAFIDFAAESGRWPPGRFRVRGRPALGRRGGRLCAAGRGGPDHQEPIRRGGPELPAPIQVLADTDGRSATCPPSASSDSPARPRSSAASMRAWTGPG